jgi:hypothetical protein
MPVKPSRFRFAFIASLLVTLTATHVAAAARWLTPDIRTSPRYPVSVISSPLNSNVYVLASSVLRDGSNVSKDGSTSALLSYAVQPNGTLSQIGSPVTDAAKQAYLLTMRPAGDVLYAIFDTKIVPYTVSGTSGLPVRGVARNENNPTPPTSAAIDPLGKFLYVLRGSLAVYSIAADGKLTLAQSYAASGISGTSITISGDGRYALVTTSSTNPRMVKGTLSAYARNQTTGLLSNTAAGSVATASATPTQVLTTAQGALYVGENVSNDSVSIVNGYRESGADSISTYRLDAATGALTRLPYTALLSVYTGANFYYSNQGPFLSASSQGDVLVAVGFVNGDVFPGYVQTFAVNADQSLTQTGFNGSPFANTSSGGIAPLGSAVSQDGQTFYTANNGNTDHAWRTVNAYTTGVPQINMTSVSVGLDSIRVEAGISHGNGIVVSEIGFTYGRTPTALNDTVVVGTYPDSIYAAFTPRPIFYNVPYYVAPYLKTNAGFTYTGPAVSFSMTNFMTSTRPQETFTADSAIVTDTIPVSASLLPDGDSLQAGFAFFKEGTGDPEGSTPVYVLPATIQTSATQGKTFRASFVPPVAPNLLTDPVYELQSYITVNGTTHYSSFTRFQNTPFLKMLAPDASIWNQVSLRVVKHPYAHSGSIFFTYDSLPRTVPGINPIIRPSTLLSYADCLSMRSCGDTLGSTLTENNLVNGKTYNLRLFQVRGQDTVFVDSTTFTYRRTLFTDSTAYVSAPPFNSVKFHGHFSAQNPPAKLGYYYSTAGDFKCVFPDNQPVPENTKFSMEVVLPDIYLQQYWQACAMDSAGNIGYGNWVYYDWETPLEMSETGATSNSVTFTVYRAKRLVNGKCATTIQCPWFVESGPGKDCVAQSVGYGAEVTTTLSCPLPGNSYNCSISCTVTGAGTYTLEGNAVQVQLPE